MKERELIGSLARKAGNTLMKHFRQDWALLKERSTAKEAVTKYDKEVDRLIVEEIKKYYPHHSLVFSRVTPIGSGLSILWMAQVILPISILSFPCA
jgi:fructose-1,6-bisphosphatase/inositol monophosphatase family enzyme